MRDLPEWSSYRPLDLISGGRAGQVLQRWLLSEHNLEIELGRHARVPREQRYCKWCQRFADNYVIGDEVHSLCICGRAAVAREQCLSKMRTLLGEALGQHAAKWHIMDILYNARGCSVKVQKRIWQTLRNLLVAVEERLEAEDNDV